MSVGQEDYIAFNQYNAQLTALSRQKTQLKMVIDSVRNSLDEVEKSNTTDIYKNLGHILIKTTKEKIKKDLSGEVETLGIRVKTLEKQEELVTKKLNELKTKLEAEMKKSEKATSEPKKK